MTEATGIYQIKKMPLVVGLDPGTSFGIAIYCGGKLNALHTMKPHEAINYLCCFDENDLLIMEDSRLQSTNFRNATKDSKAVAFAKGRSVGRVDMLCQMVEWACEEQGIALICLSPKAKGAKINSDELKAVTGWARKSNQHERDGAMVAWPFRNKSANPVTKLEAR